MPSATALKQLADVLGVTTDYLLSEDEQQVQIKDKGLLKKFEEIQNLNEETKKVVDTFLDLVIRDNKAKKAYSS